MLFISKQRTLALEELQKSELEREFLAARVSQLEAEQQAAMAQQELLQQRLRSSDSALQVLKSQGGDPPSPPPCLPS